MIDTSKPVRLAHTIGSITRLGAVEDLSYPMAVTFRQIGVVLPAFLYYFVARLFEAEGTANHAAVGDYYTFLIIGLATSAVLQALLSGFGSQLQYAQDRGVLETLLVEPVPWLILPIALNLWRLMLGAVGAGLLLAIGGLLGAEYRLAGVPAFVGIVALGAVATSAVGITAASLLVLAKRSAPALSLYGLVASLFAGTLFPIELIPGWLRWVSFLVPHTYTIDLGRAFLMQAPPPPVVSIEQAVLGLAVFSVFGLAAGLWLFSRSLQYSRKMGLLSGY